MDEFIPAAQVALQVMFILTVAFKTVQEAMDIQRKRLEIKRERQKLNDK
jgi:hypothetical protein